MRDLDSPIHRPNRGNQPVKDDEERLVYLTDDALEAISQNLKGRRKGYVFQTDTGKQLRPDYLGTQLRRFRKHLQRKLERQAEDYDGPVPAFRHLRTEDSAGHLPLEESDRAI